MSISRGWDRVFAAQRLRDRGGAEHAAVASVGRMPVQLRTSVSRDSSTRCCKDIFMLSAGTVYAAASRRVRRRTFLQTLGRTGPGVARRLSTYRVAVVRVADQVQDGRVGGAQQYPRLPGLQDSLKKRQAASCKLFTFVVRIVVRIL